MTTQTINDDSKALDDETDPFDASSAVSALTDLNHPTKTKVADWAKAELLNPNIEDDNLHSHFWADGWQKQPTKV